jgi:hypothetical protein
MLCKAKGCCFTHLAVLRAYLHPILYRDTVVKGMYDNAVNLFTVHQLLSCISEQELKDELEKNDRDSEP